MKALLLTMNPITRNLPNCSRLAPMTKSNKSLKLRLKQPRSARESLEAGRFLAIPSARPLSNSACGRMKIASSFPKLSPVSVMYGRCAPYPKSQSLDSRACFPKANGPYALRAVNREQMETVVHDNPRECLSEDRHAFVRFVALSDVISYPIFSTYVGLSHGKGSFLQQVCSGSAT